MTSIWHEGDPAALLTHVMELDLAAMEGYRIASEHLDNEAYRAQMQVFMGDHERHLRELEPIVRGLGGVPPAANAKIRMLPGMVTIAGRDGDDAILLAMQNNEMGVGEAYRDALERAPAEAHDVIARGCRDEKRHVQWLSVTLADLNAAGSYRGSAPPQRPGAPPR